MSRLFAVILKCFKLLDMSYLPMHYVHIFNYQHFNGLIGTSGEK